MCRYLRTKATLLSISLFLPPCAYAGGSWVGNSPIMVASAPTTIFPPSYSSRLETPEKQWNSLLLPDGKSRFSINAGNTHYDGDVTNYYLNFGYDHAFSENWTTFGFTTWGYSLLPGNGKGSEVALFFGLLDGFSYSNYGGLQLGPGVGVGYSFSTDHWRLSTRLSASGLYSLRLAELQSSQLRLNADVQYFISDNWAVGLDSGVRYYTSLEDFHDYDCAERGCYQTSGRLFAENTMAYLTRKIAKNSEINLGLGTRQNVRIGYDFSW